MTRFQPPGKESACGAHQHVSLWRHGKPAFAARGSRTTPLEAPVTSNLANLDKPKLPRTLNASIEAFATSDFCAEAW
ncbi:hypothetical protein [Mesorhizobium sp. NZP2077]|uniref:hypothetical protein n=1 Tax=Mesorhizobium sp. NZP2077 TaxID=2483404 RepID=UPI001FEDA3DC|nr:hypothetical protein [Mesorhizobium sp. NZP2077]